jgi:transcription-repair coupling factor (superfamily II helicase)
MIFKLVWLLALLYETNGTTTPKRATRSLMSPSPSSLSLLKTKVGLQTLLNEETKVILGTRVCYPGDYVVHELFGVGKYIGIRLADITPAREQRTLQPVLVIAYNHGELHLFKRLAEKQLHLYRSFVAVQDELLFSSPHRDDDYDDGFGDYADDENPRKHQHLLSNLLDLKKWKRKYSNAAKQTKISAIQLMKLNILRNNYHRTPYLRLSSSSSASFQLDDPASIRYAQFEQSFAYEPTFDQKACFHQIMYDMSQCSRPMDRLVCGDVGFGKTEVD